MGKRGGRKGGDVGWIRDYGADPSSNLQGVAELGTTLGALGTIGRKDSGLVSNATESAAPGPVTSAGAANSTSGALLREDLAQQAGIPRSLNNVWGSTLDDLKASYQMDGWTVIDKAPKTGSSGNAQVFSVDAPAGGDTPVVKQVQYSPASDVSTHSGEYYKFSYTDGTTVKIINPDTYVVKSGGGGSQHDIL